MSDETVTVLVAGDAARFASLVWPAGAEIEQIGFVSTGTEAESRVLADLPDVLLLDTRIEHADARAVSRRIREWAPATRVLTVTEHDDEQAYTTVVAGATGAVRVHAGADGIADAVRRTARGESLLLPRMASRLLHDVDAWAMRSADPIHPPPSLTATEREVLARLGEGTGTEAIASDHGVTAHLVNVHVGFAVAKLHRYVLGAEVLADRR